MHILHTVLYTFPKALKKTICFNNGELLWLAIISSIIVTLSVIPGWYCKDKLGACHSPWVGQVRGWKLAVVHRSPTLSCLSYTGRSLSFIFYRVTLRNIKDEQKLQRDLPRCVAIHRFVIQRMNRLQKA